MKLYYWTYFACFRQHKGTPLSTLPIDSPAANEIQQMILREQQQSLPNPAGVLDSESSQKGLNVGENWHFWRYGSSTQEAFRMMSQGMRFYGKIYFWCYISYYLTQHYISTKSNCNVYEFIIQCSVSYHMWNKCSKLVGHIFGPFSYLRLSTINFHWLCALYLNDARGSLTKLMKSAKWLEMYSSMHLKCHHSI